MKLKYFSATLIIVAYSLGVLSGFLWHALPFASKQNISPKVETILSRLLQSYGAKIPSNRSCGQGETTVGNAISHLLAMQLSERKNLLSLSCDTTAPQTQYCSLIFNGCAAAYSSECGSEILKFSLERDQLLTSSIQCTQTP